MTSASSVTQQALLLKLLQQEQLQQAATAQAATTKAAADKTATAAASATTPASSASSVDTSQSPQVGSGFSAALSQLGSARPEKSAHGDSYQGDRKVDQAVQSYNEQGPSNETGDSTPNDTAA